MPIRGHLWTIAPFLRPRLRAAPFPASRSWEASLEDSKVGTVRLSGWLREIPESDEILLLVHGLGGGTESHYLRGAVAAAEAAGISSLRVNLRGSDRRGEDIFHAGLTADLHAALASAELRRYRRVYALGYSLGGHLALRLGSEAGDPRLAAVAAICSPLDLELAQREIDSPRRWIYRRYLMHGLYAIYAAVAARRPVRCRSRRWSASAPSASGTTAWWLRATVSPAPATTTPGRAWPRACRPCACRRCSSTPNGIRWSRRERSAPPSAARPPGWRSAGSPAAGMSPSRGRWRWTRRWWGGCGGSEGRGTFFSSPVPGEEKNYGKGFP